MDLFPKHKMLPETLIQAALYHFPRHQEAGLAVRNNLILCIYALQLLRQRAGIMSTRVPSLNSVDIIYAIGPIHLTHNNNSNNHIIKEIVHE